MPVGSIPSSLSYLLRPPVTLFSSSSPTPYHRHPDPASIIMPAIRPIADKFKRSWTRAINLSRAKPKISRLRAKLKALLRTRGSSYDDTPSLSDERPLCSSVERPSRSDNGEATLSAAKPKPGTRQAALSQESVAKSTDSSPLSCHCRPRRRRNITTPACHPSRVWWLVRARLYGRRLPA